MIQSRLRDRHLLQRELQQLSRDHADEIAAIHREMQQLVVQEANPSLRSGTGLGSDERSPQHKAKETDAMAEQPNVATYGVVRWRRADLREVIATRFGVELSEWSVGRLLNGRGFRRLSVRPRHPQSDAAAQEAFKKTSPTP